MRYPLYVICGLSVLDLVVTLFYMHTVGMYEANPLVRALAETSHPTIAITLLKVASVATGVGLLHVGRRQIAAQVAAWLMTGVLVWVTVQWARYGVVMMDLDWVGMSSLTPLDGDWVGLRG
jgi:hypothetical protein